MHEDLLGYLLGALEPHEMERVAELVRNDPSVQAELARIEEALRPLEDACEPPPRPSSDLVARTLGSLPPLPQSGAQPSMNLVPMGDSVESSNRSSMNWLDWVSGSVAVAILLGLLLPTIAQGRFESRKAACQDQLRQFGTALTNFVTRNTQNQLPAVAERGPEAFAGVYAVRLHEAGLLDDALKRWCPSLDPPGSTNDPFVDVDQLVSVNDLHQASVSRLKELQRTVGGHYAYTLGVVQQNRLTAPKYEARSTFAVMSDAPMTSVAPGQVSGKATGHGGIGINVLFEDGRVYFFSLQALEAMPDHPLRNHRGNTEAGVNTNDASLAPSWRPPFVNVRQR